jgi:hypothetical protein
LLTSRRFRPLLLAIALIPGQAALAQFNYSLLVGTSREVGVFDDHMSAVYLQPWSFTLNGQSLAGHVGQANQQSWLDPLQIRADGAVWAEMDPYHDNNRSYSLLQARFSLTQAHLYHVSWNFTGDSVDADNHNYLAGRFTPLGDLLALGTSGDQTGILMPGVYDVFAECAAFNKSYTAGRIDAAFSFLLDVAPVPEPTSLLGAVGALAVLRRRCGLRK